MINCCPADICCPCFILRKFKKCWICRNSDSSPYFVSVKIKRETDKLNKKLELKHKKEQLAKKKKQDFDNSTAGRLIKSVKKELKGKKRKKKKKRKRKKK